MGADIARAALAAGHDVVATGRDPEAVRGALGDADRLLIVKLDVTSRDTPRRPSVRRSTVRAVDVLVNNAASFVAGYFEELAPEQIERQLATSLLGPMNVTRAVLPAMREQRSGHVVTISSSAGLAGFEYCSAYAASKFGVEGWMESLAAEVEPFGIHTTIVNPASSGRSCHDASTNYATPSIADYAERNAAQHEFWEARTAGRPVTRPSSPRRCWRSRPRPARRAASSAAPTRSRPPSSGRRSPAADRRLPRSLHLTAVRSRRGGDRMIEQYETGRHRAEDQPARAGLHELRRPHDPGRARVVPRTTTTRSRSSGRRSSSGSRSGTPRTSTRREPRRRSSAARSSATRGARTSCSPPRCSARCTTARAGRACRARRSSSRSTRRSRGSAPTTSTSTRSTASIRTPRSRRRWRRCTTS